MCLRLIPWDIKWPIRYPRAQVTLRKKTRIAVFRRQRNKSVQPMLTLPPPPTPLWDAHSAPCPSGGEACKARGAARPSPNRHPRSIRAHSSAWCFCELVVAHGQSSGQPMLWAAPGGTATHGMRQKDTIHGPLPTIKRVKIRSLLLIEFISLSHGWLLSNHNLKGPWVTFEQSEQLPIAVQVSCHGKILIDDLHPSTST